MKKRKLRPGSGLIQVDGSYEVIRVAWPAMSGELAEDLKAYGFYEQFAAAEQLWAIEAGLAEPVEDFDG